MNQVSILNFQKLEIDFIKHKKRFKKVSEKSIEAYITTFKYLIEFFKDTDIENLDLENFEAFQNFLIEKKLSNRTINKHIAYLKNFLDFAKSRRFISENRAKNLEMLDESEQKKKRKELIQNYSDKEIQALLTYKFDKTEYQKIFYILAYTGMRISEVYNLTQKDIEYDKEKNIYYFHIKNSKTLSGMRKIPLHKKLLELNIHRSYPKFNISENAFKKRIINRLYKAIPQAIAESKNVHTIRGTFAQKATSLHPDKLHIIQEILGHAKNHNEHVTIDIYAKGYGLDTKKEIIDSIDYF